VISTEDNESKKYHAARYAWSKKNQRTPKGMRWDAWFAKMFGEDLYVYADRKAKKKGAEPP
tara:strand:- start:644 stop:826 length:183 start_codon:yes stop_codon:yes gene_type:complete